MNTLLEELEQSGFLLTIKDFGKQKKESRFRLVDEYTLFYLKWGQKAKEAGERTDEKFWMNVSNTPSARIWAGYAFEIICLKHLPNIKEALGIAGVLTTASSWLYKPTKKSKERST